MINLKSVALVLFIVVFGFASVNAEVVPGPIASINYPISFVDHTNGNTYQGQIIANEMEKGVGNVYFSISTPHLSLTTVGKGWNNDRLPGEPPVMPPTLAIPPSGDKYRPLALIAAGSADNQAVDIGAHVVEISAHAFVHSDAPNKIVFIGPVTVDVRIDNKAGNIRVTIWTPKGKIKLGGKLY